MFVAALWEVQCILQCDSYVDAMNALQIPAGYPAVPIELVGASVLSLSHLHCWHPTQSDTCRSSSRVPERQELPELDGKTPKMSPAEVASFPDAFSGVEVRHDSCNSKVPRWEDLPGYPFCAPLEVDGPCVFACFGKAQAVPQRYATSPPLCCINALQGKCAQVWHQPCPFVGTVLSQREEMGKFDQVRFVGSHSLSKALGPWLAAEIPYLIETGVVTHKGLVA